MDDEPLTSGILVGDFDFNDRGILWAVVEIHLYRFLRIQMKRRNVIGSICIASVTVLAANWAIERAAANSIPRQTIRRIDTAGPVIDVIAVGNSLVAAGFDPTSFQEAFMARGLCTKAVNGGLGSSTTVEHLALTRVALRGHVLRNLIYGFGDQQMSAERPLKNSDLIGNYAMLYYQEPQLALQYAGFDSLNRVEFQIFRRCALFRERSNIWTKVEKLRRIMEEMGMPHQETNQFGRKADLNRLESADSDEFARRCRSVMQSEDFISPAVQELFKEAEASGTRVTVVEMPMSPLHLRRFYDQPVWNEFRTQNKRAVQRAGASYIDASRWMVSVR